LCRINWTVTVAESQEQPPDSVEYESLEDAELAAAAAGGRHPAFDVLVARHGPAVYRLCFRFLGNHADAADAAQDTFLRAYRGLGGFKGRSAFGTWLYRIAVNVCMSRRSGTRVPEDIKLESLAAAEDGNALDRLIAGQRDQRVRDAIARLPGKQRAALVLRVYQELPHRDIASMLGTSVGAVKANVFHALKNLRKVLGGER
jgi:RNA polymerase sigma-70 factor (ECF subfamily)